MFVAGKRGAAVAAVLSALALSLGACAESGSSSSGGKDGNAATPTPSGGYDSKGYPLDSSGEVSSNPDDYRDSICATELAKQASDYDSECK
jgi:hypothetical protein